MSWPLALLDALLGQLWPRAQQRAQRPTSTDPEGCCPRCERVPLVLEHGALHEAVCPRCQGRYLPADATERLVISELGIERGTLLELALHTEVPRIACPGCKAALWAVRLRGQPVSLCRSCGGLWCDAGELRALSGGRYQEVVADAAAPPPNAPAGARDVESRNMCVLQLDSKAVEEQLLIAAFTEAPRFTRADATRMARLACGLVAEGVSVEEGAQLVEVLARLGVLCAAVPTDTLALPRAREIIRMEPEQSHFVLPDQYGTRREISWSDVEVAALARVMLEPATSTPAKKATRRRRFRGLGSLPLPSPSPTHEAASADAVEEILLDLLLPRSGERLRLRALSVGLPQSARIGDRRRSFLALAKQILARVTPAALPARTAAFLEHDVVPRYDNLLHFERDLACLRYRRARAALPLEGVVVEDA